MNYGSSSRASLCLWVGQTVKKKTNIFQLLICIFTEFLLHYLSWHQKVADADLVTDPVIPNLNVYFSVFTYLLYDCHLIFSRN